MLLLQDTHLGEANRTTRPETTGEFALENAAPARPVNSFKKTVTDPADRGDRKSSGECGNTSAESVQPVSNIANLRSFTTNILNLKRLALGSATKYVTAAVGIADLETVVDFVRAVADLKKNERIERGASAGTPTGSPQAQQVGAGAA
jgi:hypothetical protein